MNAGELRHRITIQKLDPDTEQWSDYINCFAKVNNSGGKEYLNGGAIQQTINTVFTIRYNLNLKDMYLNTQAYRILFNGGTFDIVSVDNYMFRNESLKIGAVGRNGH